MSEETPGKKTELGARWKPMWTTHIGCIKGCVDFLGVDVSLPWLFGGTGHAFALNVHNVVCPSGPTAWKKERFFRLGDNLGYATEIIFSHKSQPDFAEKQKLTWDRIRQALDEGLPCYGWELDAPEFYVVYGYDETGYLFSGPFYDHGGGHKPWGELGDTGIGVIEMCIVKPGEAADDATVVKDALEFAVAHGSDRKDVINDLYKAGLAGYDLWIEAMVTGKADGFGTSYNAAVWTECRQFAVKFLQEAKGRIGGDTAPPFDKAAGLYQAVAHNLKTVSETYPFKGPDTQHDMTDTARRDAVVEALKAAREVEQKALELLAQIAGLL